MLTKNYLGQTIRVFSYSGPMRKHGGDRQMRQDPTIAALNAAASAPRTPYRGVVVRKARR